MIVKYFPPGRRISGVSTFVNLLAEQLATHVDVHLIASCGGEIANRWNSEKASRLHPVRGSFWLKSPTVLRDIKADIALVVSGIHRSRLIAPAFHQFVLQASRHTRLGFFQAVNLDRPPGFFARRTLSRFYPQICSSRSLASMLPETFRHVPPAISLDAIDRVGAHAKQRRIRVGYFNHFNTTKGFDLALQAFRLCVDCDVEFCVAGAGPLERRMRAEFDGKDGIHFLGTLTNPIGCMKSCDFTVLPFRTSKTVLGVSQAALESLACGVPVVGTNQSAITEAVRHEKEGLICEREDDLPKQISRLIKDDLLRCTLSANACLRAKSFDLPIIATHFQESLFPE